MNMQNKIRQYQIARRGQRYPTRFTARLVADRKPFVVTIRDISCVGACLVGDDLPMRGTEVVMSALGVEVVATVVWSDGAACGINFHRAIEPLDVVRRNTRAPGRRTTPALAMYA